MDGLGWRRELSVASVIIVLCVPKRRLAALRFIKEKMGQLLSEVFEDTRRRLCLPAKGGEPHISVRFESRRWATIVNQAIQVNACSYIKNITFTMKSCMLVCFSERLRLPSQVHGLVTNSMPLVSVIRDLVIRNVVTAHIYLKERRKKEHRSHHFTSKAT
jgi:hypothetical protein